MLQTVQNNFTDGLTGVLFDVSEKDLKITFFEGIHSHIIEPGIGQYNHS